MKIKTITIRRSADVGGDRYNKVHLELSAELELGDDEDDCLKTFDRYVEEQVIEMAKPR